MVFLNMLRGLLLVLLLSPLAALALPTTYEAQNTTTVSLSTRQGGLSLGSDFRVICRPTNDPHKCLLRSFQGFDWYADFTVFDGYCNAHALQSGRVGDHFSIGAAGFQWTVEVDWDHFNFWVEPYSFKYGAFSSQGTEQPAPTFDCLYHEVDRDRPFYTCLREFDC